MGNNYFIPWSATPFTATAFNAPLTTLDRIATYNRPKIITCDGFIYWDSAAGILYWTDDIHIYFTDSAGVARHNWIDHSEGGEGNAFITLTSNKFCYVDLNESDQAVTALAATVSTGSASNFLSYDTAVLGYRNTVDNQFYPVALTPVFAQDSVSFAEIYTHENATPTVLALQDTDYQVVVFNVNGLSNNMTPDHTNDHITVVRKGKYLCNISFSFNSSTADNYIFHVSKNDNAAEFENLHAERTTGIASSFGSASVSGVVDLAVDDTIEFWVQRTTGGGASKSLIVKNATLTLTQLVDV
jgi:hypothetical protein